ncbi:sterile alpha motif domain-containing protein 9-like isoform X2 [Parambassis ranga]|nr:sterile alpha motif domain-containing protein 9-like isoform X2 [Parambassis ranga]
MDHNQRESPTSAVVSDEAVTQFENYWQEQLSHYVQKNPPRWSTNTKVFSFLALLNAYVPDSYLLKDECQRILGPPDPIHGGPPFEERMEPFTRFIHTSNPGPEHVCMIHPQVARKAVELLAVTGFTRSTTAKDLMVSLCGDQPQPHIIQFIKYLLTKREMQEGCKEKFSKLVSDVMEHENHYNAVSVLKTASNKFTQNPNFPQTISRLYHSLCQRIFYSNKKSQPGNIYTFFQYRQKITRHYRSAETWARNAINRAPRNSYMADTLGQVYMHQLMNSQHLSFTTHGVVEMANQAFKAFEDVEDKAEKEVVPQMEDPGGTVNISDSFNNRGLFGFIQVANIVFKKLDVNTIPDLGMQVETKFTFFEWYLTYSKPSMTTLEPHYFWKNVVLCYENYTGQRAAASTSFPGLLDHLNRGLFTSRGQRAFKQEAPSTQRELEIIRDHLRSQYEENPEDVDLAERYVLSNIILSNKMPNAPHLDLVTELQIILYVFLGTDVGLRNSEFYLLVLLLFWPEEHHQGQQEDDEECQATEDEEVNTRNGEDEDIDGLEPAQPSPAGLVFDLDLQQYVTFMERAFERAMYDKYLRGRYLLPLFFLGKGSGLSRWIHKSRLDAIVEENVDKGNRKMRRINEMWVSGNVWHLQKVRDILLPVRVEACQPWEREGREVWVHVGEKRIKARTEVNPDGPALGTTLFYLGFTIQGPVVFDVGAPHNA